MWFTIKILKELTRDDGCLEIGGKPSCRKGIGRHRIEAARARIEASIHILNKKWSCWGIVTSVKRLTWLVNIRYHKDWRVRASSGEFCRRKQHFLLCSWMWIMEMRRIIKRFLFPNIASCLRCSATNPLFVEMAFSWKRQLKASLSSGCQSRIP